MLLNVVTDAFT